MRIAGIIKFSQKGGGGESSIHVNDIPSLIEKIKNSIKQLTVSGYDLSNTKAESLTTKLTELLTKYNEVKKEYQNLAIIKYLRDSNPNAEISETTISHKHAELSKSMVDLQMKQTAASKIGFNLDRILLGKKIH